MEWYGKQKPPLDVGLLLQRASRQISLSRLHHDGDRRMNVISRRLLDQLVKEAISETVRQLREEGAVTLARTEARLAAESRRELDALVAKVQQLAAADGEVFFLDEEKPPREPGFNASEGRTLELGRGLDLGTVNICASAMTRETGRIAHNVHRNAFLDVRGDGVTQGLLRKFGIECVVRGAKAYILGDQAVEMATIFDKTVRRPMKAGPGAAWEPEGALIVQHLLERLLGRPQTPGEICTYSVPGESVEAEQNFIYHRGVLESALRALGFTPAPMIESSAIIQGEFVDRGYTGIGMTCGGGTFNVCLAYKGIPAMSFSTARGGDWIDQCVSQATGLSAAHVCDLKERGLQLYRPQSSLEVAVAIYYRHLVKDTLQILKRRMLEADCMPSLDTPVDIVCAGGTAMIGGFTELVREELGKIQLPIPVGEVRLAHDPLRAVAAGCLRAAMEEMRALEADPTQKLAPLLDRNATVVLRPPPSRSPLRLTG